MSIPKTELSFPSTSRPSARYVSDTLVFEEALCRTRWIRLYHSASGQIQRENVTERLPSLKIEEFPLQAFQLEIDGQDLGNGWKHVSSVERPGKRAGVREAVVTLEHLVRPVTVKVVTGVDGTPFVIRYLEITNTSDKPAALSRVSPMSGLLFSWNPYHYCGELPIHSTKSGYTLGFFDGAAAGTEGNFKWEALPRGWRKIGSSTGQSGFSTPTFMVRDEVTGELAIGSLAWSGNWAVEFWNDPHLNISNTPRGAHLGFQMGPTGPSPLRVLAPGETITSPELHLGILHCGFDQAVGAWHEHLRTSVIPPRPAGKDFFHIGGRVVEEPGDWILREIDIAAEMGLKSFMVDAGWYGDEFSGWELRRGDWNVGSWMPGGSLAVCREHCHKKGMLFGLWMEPESTGSKSRLLKEHPEWLLHSDDNRQIYEMLDLSHPEAARYVHDEILRVIREHQLDFFKIDYNTRVFEGGQRQRDGFLESELWRHYELLYSIFDEVRREMPNVALECCASGGGRNDLGMLSRFHYAAESDFSLFPRSIRAINGMTLSLPPETLCYYHNHMQTAHEQADLDTHLRVTLFAQTVFVGFGGQNADRSTPYFDKTKRYIRLAEELTGPIIAHHPYVYHHTPDIGVQGPAEWCVLEYAAQDHSSGYAGVFRLGVGEQQEYLFKPRGLNASRRYTITLDNTGATFERSGSDLVTFGIPVRLDTANTSELILFQAVAP